MLSQRRSNRMSPLGLEARLHISRKWVINPRCRVLVICQAMREQLSQQERTNSQASTPMSSEVRGEQVNQEKGRLTSTEALVEFVCSSVEPPSPQSSVTWPNHRLPCHAADSRPVVCKSGGRSLCSSRKSSALVPDRHVLTFYITA